MIELETEILVVGSGFGGAIAASRLVEQGRQVVMLERGPWRHFGEGRAFKNDEGRGFLWRIFSDPNSLIDDRRLALGLFWGYRLAENEHEKWIGRVSPLLSDPDDEIQRRVAKLLYVLAYCGKCEQLALPALVEALRAERQEGDL